jgi:hypothetical protein
VSLGAALALPASQARHDTPGAFVLSSTINNPMPLQSFPMLSGTNLGGQVSRVELDAMMIAVLHPTNRKPSNWHDQLIC